VADVAGPSVTLTNAWQKVTVGLTTTTNGGNLGLRVSQGSAVAGNAFWVDAAVLRRSS
jgi:hypothetical protein